MGRKLGLIGLALIFERGSVPQVLVSLFMSLLFLVAQSKYTPWALFARSVQAYLTRCLRLQCITGRTRSRLTICFGCPRNSML